MWEFNFVLFFSINRTYIIIFYYKTTIFNIPAGFTGNGGYSGYYGGYHQGHHYGYQGGHYGGYTQGGSDGYGR